MFPLQVIFDKNLLLNTFIVMLFRKNMKCVEMWAKFAANEKTQRLIKVKQWLFSILISRFQNRPNSVETKDGSKINLYIIF